MCIRDRAKAVGDHGIGFPVDEACAQSLVLPLFDVRQFKVASGRLSTQFGGLFLFARDLAQARLETPLAHRPPSQKVPPGPMVRALLALKLWGIGRPYRVMPDILDEGCALFAGLNAMPKKSTLSEYSTRVDEAHLVTLMDLWHQVTQQLLPEPGDTLSLIHISEPTRPY